MKGGLQLLLCCVATVYTFIPTSVYLQAIDRIIQKLLDNLDSSVRDYNTLCENIEVYNEHATSFLDKLKIKDPQFRQIAIEHCRVGKPEFPDVLNIHAFQLNLGWNDTQAANMFQLVNTSRHLWMAFDEVCQNDSYTRYLDKFSDMF